MEKTQVIYVWDIKLSNAKKLKDMQDGITVRPGELYMTLRICDDLCKTEQETDVCLPLWKSICISQIYKFKHKNNLKKLYTVVSTAKFHIDQAR